MSLIIPLKFTKSDLNAILEAAHFGDGKPHTVKSLKKAKLYDAFVKEMNDTASNFVMEIVDTSREACANDWLNEFSREE